MARCCIPQNPNTPEINVEDNWDIVVNGHDVTASMGVCFANDVEDTIHIIDIKIRPKSRCLTEMVLDRTTMKVLRDVGYHMTRKRPRDITDRLNLR